MRNTREDTMAIKNCLGKTENRQKKRLIEEMLNTFPSNLTITFKGALTKVNRLLDGRKWHCLSYADQDALLANAKFDILASQSTGFRIKKNCYLNDEFIGSAKALYAHVVKHHPQLEIPNEQLFVQHLVDKYPPNSQHQIFITTTDLSNLTLDAITPPPKTDPNAKDNRLKALHENLQKEDVDITLAGIKSCCSRLLEQRGAIWSELSPIDQTQLILSVEERVRKNQSSPHREKNWQVTENGITNTYNTKDLLVLVGKDLDENCLSYGSFRNLMNYLKHSSDINIVNQDRIINLYKLQQASFQKQKVLPGNIYKLDIIAGAYSNFYYIGATQLTLTERLKKHADDAVRYPESQRPILVAIRSALEHGSIKAVTCMNLLEGEVLPSQFRERETAFITKYDGEKCLNFHKEGFSHGGRGSTVTVNYNGTEYGLAEAYRKAGSDYGLLDAELDLFIQRAKHFYYQKSTIEEAVSLAYEGVNGRKRRDDLSTYNVGGTFMTILEILASPDFAFKNEQAIISRLRHHRVYQRNAGNTDILSILQGKDKMPAPPILDYTKMLPIGHPIKALKSWLQIANALGKPPSSIRYSAKQMTPAEFWQKYAPNAYSNLRVVRLSNDANQQLAS